MAEEEKPRLTEQLGVSLTETESAEIDRIAASSEWTRSQVGRKLIREALDRRAMVLSATGPR